MMSKKLLLYLQILEAKFCELGFGTSEIEGFGKLLNDTEGTNHLPQTQNMSCVMSIHEYTIR